MKVLHLIDQVLSSTVSKWPNHGSLLSCKYIFIPVEFTLVFSSSAEILFRALALHTHLIILTSFLSRMITLSSLTCQVSLPYRITLRTYIEYNPLKTLKNTQTIVWVIICLLRDNLPYTPKRTKSLKLLHLLLTDHLIICLVISLLCLSLHLHMPDIQTRYPFSIHLWYH